MAAGRRFSPETLAFPAGLEFPGAGVACWSQVAAEFHFQDPGALADGELTLRLEKTAPADAARGAVAAYHFVMLAAGAAAGSIRFRAQSTPDIELYAGHFGYGVDPEFRGRHYAERACRLLLPFARAHGLETVWITCNPENAASRRTCERLGAVLEEIVELPEGSDMYRKGERRKCRYRLDLPHR